ncbi:uncharacterized protein LOC124894546, partial [Capsicum annuum]|uniref:uncharacterized protein LOC124894546 n=1 Tax=Capsicum annuum TaxID=4072 RepID=UPI001FB0B9E2
MYIFIGYPKGKKGGLFYFPKEQKIIVSTNARFLEEDYLMNHVPRSKTVLQELGNRITNNETQQFSKTVIDIPLHPRSGRNVNKQGVAQEQTLDITLPQSSGSNIEQPAIVEENIQDNVEIPEEPNTEPPNYAEALHDKDVKIWIVAMKSEMESMYSNQVWELVEPPTGVKAI